MHTGFMYKKFTAGLILFIALLPAKAQDIHFSQFFEAPLLRNPSLAGLFTGDYRVQGVYRDQWNSVTNAYRTGSLNAEYKMPLGIGNDYITTGIQAVFDKAGTVGLTTTHILPAFNYHKSLSSEKPMYLSLGFMGGLIRRHIDYTKITTDNQYNGGGFDPTLPIGETFTTPNFNSWDASVGMSFNTAFGENQANSMFIGAAYHHLNRPKNSFYKNPNIEINPKYVASIGVKLNIDDYSAFTLQADHSRQGDYNETIGGALYSYKIGVDLQDPEYTIHGGLFLRWKDALVPVVKIDWSRFSAALSYDINVSQLKTVSMGRGGFELSLSYTGFVHRDNSSEYKMLCPKF